MLPSWLKKKLIPWSWPELNGMRYLFHSQHNRILRSNTKYETKWIFLWQKINYFFENWIMNLKVWTMKLKDVLESLNYGLEGWILNLKVYGTWMMILKLDTERWTLNLNVWTRSSRTVYGTWTMILKLETYWTWVYHL